MNSLELFGKRLKELRKLNKLTQEQLAELIGLDPKQICRIENGACFTTFETLQKISKIFNIEIYDLFYYEHKQTKDALVKEMNEIFKNASDDKIELIYKLVKAITFYASSSSLSSSFFILSNTIFAISLAIIRCVAAGQF